MKFIFHTSHKVLQELEKLFIPPFRQSTFRRQRSEELRGWRSYSQGPSTENENVKQNLSISWKRILIFRQSAHSSPRNSRSEGRMPHSPRCRPGWVPPRPSGHSSRERRTSTPGPLHCNIEIIDIYSIYIFLCDVIAMLYYPSALMMHVRGSHPPGVLPVAADS